MQVDIIVHVVAGIVIAVVGWVIGVLSVYRKLKAPYESVMKLVKAHNIDSPKERCRHKFVQVFDEEKGESVGLRFTENQIEEAILRYKSNVEGSGFEHTSTNQHLF